jgi:hypothetical protein
MTTTIVSELLEFPDLDSKYNNKISKTIDLLNTIDFTMVKMKLMDETEGQGWDIEYADRVEVRYKRFLCMMLVEKDFSFVPTGDIDIFWHQHILDTRAYAKDCITVFGEFLHHYPYFGLRGEDDAKDLQDSFELTKEYYLKFFGESYAGDEGNETSSKCHLSCSKSVCHTCARGCSGVTCATCKKK